MAQREKRPTKKVVPAQPSEADPIFLTEDEQNMVSALRRRARGESTISWEEYKRARRACGLT